MISLRIGAIPMVLLLTSAIASAQTPPHGSVSKPEGPTAGSASGAGSPPPTHVPDDAKAKHEPSPTHTRPATHDAAGPPKPAVVPSSNLAQ